MLANLFHARTCRPFALSGRLIQIQTQMCSSIHICRREARHGPSSCLEHASIDRPGISAYIMRVFSHGERRRRAGAEEDGRGRGHHGIASVCKDVCIATFRALHTCMCAALSTGPVAVDLPGVAYGARTCLRAGFVSRGAVACF